MKEFFIVILIVCVALAGVFGLRLVNAQSEAITVLANELLETQAALLICAGGGIVPDDDIKIREAVTDQSTNGRALASTMMW